jgi:uncharacterized phage-associated protein
MFRAVLHRKIGNLLAHLAHEVPNLALTKALKLLYMIDETAVREMGTPVTWLDHKVWRLGPVAKEVYQELRHDVKTTVGDRTFTLMEFIQCDRRESTEYPNQTDVFIRPIPGVEVDLSEFSQYEEELIGRIVTKYRSTPARELIKMLHEEDTLWHRSVTALELNRAFKGRGTSEVSIDFTELIEDDDIKLLASQSAYEALEFESSVGV